MIRIDKTERQINMIEKKRNATYELGKQRNEEDNEQKI